MVNGYGKRTTNGRIVMGVYYRLWQAENKNVVEYS